MNLEQIEARSARSWKHIAAHGEDGQMAQIEDDHDDLIARVRELEAERERADATATELAALKAAMRDVNVFNSDDVQYLRDLANNADRDDSQRKGAALLLAVLEHLYES